MTMEDLNRAKDLDEEIRKKGEVVRFLERSMPKLEEIKTENRREGNLFLKALPMLRLCNIFKNREDHEAKKLTPKGFVFWGDTHYCMDIDMDEGLARAILEYVRQDMETLEREFERLGRESDAGREAAER